MDRSRGPGASCGSGREQLQVQPQSRWARRTPWLTFDTRAIIPIEASAAISGEGVAFRAGVSEQRTAVASEGIARLMPPARIRRWRRWLLGPGSSRAACGAQRGDLLLDDAWTGIKVPGFRLGSFRRGPLSLGMGARSAPSRAGVMS